MVRHISLNISGFTGQIFAIFSTYERALCANDGFIPYFPICHARLPWQPNNIAVIKANWYYMHSLHVRQLEYGFVLLLLATNATISCKILVKIGSVVSAENILIKIVLHVLVVVRRILLNISRCTGPNIAIFSPYESALRADDGSVLYFIICQGTLPWQPNNVAKMKANRYYVHSLHDRQMVARFRFAMS